MQLTINIKTKRILYTDPLCFTEFHFSSCKRLWAVIPLPSLRGHSDSHDIMQLLLLLKSSASYARQPQCDVVTTMSASRATCWLTFQDTLFFGCRIRPLQTDCGSRLEMKQYLFRHCSSWRSSLFLVYYLIWRWIWDMWFWGHWFRKECIYTVHFMCLAHQIYKALTVLIITTL